MLCLLVFQHFQSLQGEGVAYRGRVLVELSTKLEGKADKTVDSIHSDDILVVQVKASYPTSVVQSDSSAVSLV